MAGRGRGRGRGGRGLMGLDGPSKNEPQLPIVVTPPTDFPTLKYRAPKLEFTAELGYWIQLKGERPEFLKDSPLNVTEMSKKKDIERYSDHLNALINTKVSYDKLYNWTKLPNELKLDITKRKKKSVVPVDSKKNKVDDVDKQLKLRELEQKESTMNSDDEDEEKEKTTKAGDDDNDDDAANNRAEDDEDEDMDEGTDYANAYFDNGEGYGEEDDNLDDDAVY